MTRKPLRYLFHDAVFTVLLPNQLAANKYLEIPPNATHQLAHAPHYFINMLAFHLRIFQRSFV